MGGRSGWSGLFYDGHKSEPNQVYRESKDGERESIGNFQSAMRERAVSLEEDELGMVIEQQHAVFV